MQGHRERIDRLDELVADVRSRGIAGCYAEDERSDGRHVRIGGRDLVNFASCSYLGLELDPRLIEGAVEAVRAHGVETSSSRAYLSSSLYSRAESLLGEIFQAPIVVSNPTSAAALAIHEIARRLGERAGGFAPRRVMRTLAQRFRQGMNPRPIP